MKKLALVGIIALVLAYLFNDPEGAAGQVNDAASQLGTVADKAVAFVTSLTGSTIMIFIGLGVAYLIANKISR